MRSKRSGSFLRRVLHQRRQHQCAQGQGDDAEQGGEDHASGRELLLMAASPASMSKNNTMTCCAQISASSIFKFLPAP